MERFPFDRIFESCGRMWHIRRANMDKLWANMEGEEDAPYWNEIWPSSLALAGWLYHMQNAIRGKRCLDLGCGLGFTALLGCFLGANVTAIDYKAEALEYAKINAAINNIRGVDFTVMDWRYPAFNPESFDFIWAGDIMYEKDFASPIASFLSSMLQKNGKAWIAEPGRDIFHCLLDIMPSYNLNYKRVRAIAVSPLTEQAVPVPVSLWEITKEDLTAPMLSCS